jgi:uncharacterized membrane protein HdeD (DUF308 family)
LTSSPDQPAPVGESTPTPLPDAPATAAGAATAQGGMARATAFTQDLLERSAPWSSRSSWTIVAAEGVVAIILGLIFLFEPLGGQAVTLQLMGIILLVAALITAFQLWQHTVRPDLEVLVAFRTGSGLTIGLVVIAATLFAATTGQVSAAMAVVVGIGYLVFGLTGVAGTLTRRRADAAWPLVALGINGVLAAAGLVLLIAGAAGTGTVGSVFKLLGVALIVCGLVLCGYAYLLRQQVVNGVRG